MSIEFPTTAEQKAKKEAYIFAFKELDPLEASFLIAEAKHILIQIEPCIPKMIPLDRRYVQTLKQFLDRPDCPSKIHEIRMIWIRQLAKIYL